MNTEELKEGDILHEHIADSYTYKAVSVEEFDCITKVTSIDHEAKTLTTRVILKRIRYARDSDKDLELRGKKWTQNFSNKEAQGTIVDSERVSYGTKNLTFKVDKLTDEELKQIAVFIL